jgi:small-conductance mechanosensitive channel
MDARNVAPQVLAQSEDGGSLVDDLEEALKQAQISGWDVVAAIAVLAAAIPIGSLVRRAVERALGRFETIPTIVSQDVARLARWVVYLLALGVALSVLGVDVAWIALLTVFTLIVVGLTLRPIVENTSAALVLTMRPAFGVGDEIAVGDFAGTVVEIGSHSTVLKTVDGVRIHVPNTSMLGQTVKVYTAFDTRRTEFAVSVPAGTDLAKAASCIVDALSSVDAVVSDPPPEALIGALDQDAIVYKARFWYPSSMPTDAAALSDAIGVVHAALLQRGIEPGGPTSAVSIEGRIDTAGEDGRDAGSPG